MPIKRFLFTLVMLIWLVDAPPACGGENQIDRLIQQAGNSASDEARLECLGELRRSDGLDATFRSDLDRLITEIERWIGGESLDYFGREISRTLDYDFGIPESSPLYPLTHIYRGRMVTWYALESGGVWNNPARKNAFLTAARLHFEQAASAFPENEIVAMYLGRPVPPAKYYPKSEGAPEWAVYQREGLERLTDIIEWWISHRMRADGQYGGGWGDDCEMWRWWTPILIGFEHPQINQAQARFSAALLSQPHMKLGYTSRMSDVEHTAEDTADAITPMIHIDPDNPDWSRRSARLVELMESLWTGRNERGFLQFKSTYFTGDKVDLTPNRACDTVYHPRVIQPALVYWQRTGDPGLTELVSAWMDTWVDAAAQAEHGKPAGVIPTAIHWPDGRAGGLDPNWWDPRNHGEHTLYLFPSAMSLMTHTLLLTYHMTGEEKYLDPIRSMASIRLDYLNGNKGQENLVPGSERWCAARLGGLTAVAAKYKFLTGRNDFDALLSREMSPYVRFRLESDPSALVAGLKANAEALRVNFPGYTSEVRYTDRVLRFPTLFGPSGIVDRTAGGVGSPNPALLYSSVTGDPGTPDYFPLNAVRWLTPPREIAALVTRCDTEGLGAQLFHFGEEPRPMKAEFYMLAPGVYEFTLRLKAGGAQRIVERRTFSVTGRRTRVPFALPARGLCVLDVHRKDERKNTSISK